MPNILDTLKSEHDVLRALFREVNATADAETERRANLLKGIEDALVPHAKWEETVFYPAFAERANHQQLLLYTTSMAEHRAVELAVLPDLMACDLDSREFAGTAKVLSEQILHHAEEEETELFAAVRQLFSADELMRMDDDYAEWKQSGAGEGTALYAKAKTTATSLLRNPGSPA